MKCGRGGFTLIEMIGVLAIIAIIASAIVPNVAREVRRSIAEAEDKQLDVISNALIQHAIQYRVLSGSAAGEWNADVAPFLDLPSSQIINNRSAGTRRLIWRPTNGLGGSPYNQTARFSAGVTPQGTLPSALPVQAKCIMISDLSGTAPVLNLTDAQFDAVWQQSGATPAGFTENEKFRIRRLGFTGNFYPVTVNCADITGVPRWSIDGAPAKSLNANSMFTVYLLSGTQVNLFTGGSFVTTKVVSGPLSVAYDGANWSY